ncbi:MAG: biotin--[acetyl-CoA-carboxylase] ligase [Alphaproteobacteria bacterium]
MILEIDLSPPFRVIRFDDIGSTSDEAKQLAEAGAAHGTLVWAASQSQGRGRRGNSWHSPPGNLYVSLVLRPDCVPAQAMQLTFVASLALADTIAAFAPASAEVTCKWPNDVFINHQKTAGLLLESSTSGGAGLDWLVIGMGVNIAHAPDDVSQPVTSLEAEGCTDLTPGRLLEAFCACFTEHYKQWLDDGFASQREAWLLRAEGRGGPVTVNLEGESFAGRFVDLDETGALIVDTVNSGRRVVTAGEVFIL